MQRNAKQSTRGHAQCVVHCVRASADAAFMPSQPQAHHDAGMRICEYTLICSSARICAHLHTRTGAHMRMGAWVHGCVDAWVHDRMDAITAYVGARAHAPTLVVLVCSYSMRAAYTWPIIVRKHANPAAPTPGCDDASGMSDRLCVACACACARVYAPLGAQS